jgi:hypothetical protein
MHHRRRLCSQGTCTTAAGHIRTTDNTIGGHADGASRSTRISCDTRSRTPKWSRTDRNEHTEDTALWSRKDRNEVIVLHVPKHVGSGCVANIEHELISSEAGWGSLKEFSTPEYNYPAK